MWNVGAVEGAARAHLEAHTRWLLADRLQVRCEARTVLVAQRVLQVGLGAALAVEVEQVVEHADVLWRSRARVVCRLGGLVASRPEV